MKARDLLYISFPLLCSVPPGYGHRDLLDLTALAFLFILVFMLLLRFLTHLHVNELCCRLSLGALDT